MRRTFLSAPEIRRSNLTGLPARILMILLLAGLGAQGCSPAESREDAVPAEERPAFTLVAETGADTSFTYTVDVRDSLVVFGRGRDVVVVNVAVPSHPRVLAFVTLTDAVRDVVLRGSYAYAAANTGGLHIIDLSDPAAPALMGRILFGDRAYGVDAADGRAYVAARSEGLRILDVSDPQTPLEIGHILTPDEAVDVVVRGDVAYVAAWYASMRVIDVGDPAAPEEVSFAAYDSYDNGAAWSVHVDGDMGVQAVPDMGLRTVDVSDPRDVKLYKVYRGLFAPVGAFVSGRTAYVADQDAGFRVLDLADPRMPVEIGALDLPGSAMSAALSGTVAYVASREGGLRIVDVSRPYAPREIAHVDASDDVADVTLIGDTLVAAGRQNGVLLHRETANLEGAGFIAGPSTRVASYGNVLLVGSPNRIGIYDRSDVATPLGATSVQGTVHGLAANDDVLIAATERFGIRIWATNTLRELGAFEPDRALLATSNRTQMLRTPVAAWDVLLDGRRVIAAFDDGIRLLDVSTPSRPTVIGMLATPQRVYRLALRGSQLFAACDDGLRVIDVSDPAQPTELSFLKTPSFATAIAFDNDHLYVGDLSGIVTVVTTTLPLTPLAEVKVADRILGLTTWNGGLAVAAGPQGVRIVADLLPSDDSLVYKVTVGAPSHSPRRIRSITPRVASIRSINASR